MRCPASPCMIPCVEIRGVSRKSAHASRLCQLYTICSCNLDMPAVLVGHHACGDEDGGPVLGVPAARLVVLHSLHRLCAGEDAPAAPGARGRTKGGRSWPCSPAPIRGGAPKKSPAACKMRRGLITSGRPDQRAAIALPLGASSEKRWFISAAAMRKRFSSAGVSGCCASDLNLFGSLASPATRNS